MPKIPSPALAVMLLLAATATAHAMGGGVGSGGGVGFGLPLWQPPGVSAAPAPDWGNGARRHVRRAYGHVARHHHHG